MAGVKPGDYILSIDGVSTSSLKTYLELIHALQGAPGSSVKLELKRINSKRTETLNLTRAKQLFSVDIPK